MDFVKGKLDASHMDHDTFIYKYVKKVRWLALEDVVLLALRAELVARDETDLRTWVEGRLLRGPDNDFLSFHYMALYIMLTQYSTQWPGMFEATYNLLMDMLFHIIGSKYLIFPPKWTRQVFRLENCLSPAEIKGVMWGIDPIPRTDGYGKYATGYAFTFAVPDENDLTTEASSSKGLKEVYGLDISLNQDDIVEEQFVKEYGIGLVNFIRTIEGCPPETRSAGERNDFKHSWIPYNLEWLNVLNINLKDKVMVFQNEEWPFNNYFPNNSDFEDLKTLISEKRWPHPSRIKKDESTNHSHCLNSPDSYYDPVNACTSERCNESVTDCVRFLQSLGADDAISCKCATCTIEGNDVSSNC
jgi:hypothetical protein